MLAADAATIVLSLVLSAFFWRTHRTAPGTNAGYAAYGFLLWGIGHAAGLGSRWIGEMEIEAARVFLPFVGTLVMGLAYLPSAVPPRVRSVAAITFFVLLAGILSAYAIGLAMPSALAMRPSVRAADAVALAAYALHIVRRVGVNPLAFRTALGFGCLALDRYSTALLAYGVAPDDITIPHAWRFLGLAFLVSVTWPARGVRLEA